MKHHARTDRNRRCAARAAVSGLLLLASLGAGCQPDAADDSAPGLGVEAFNYADSSDVRLNAVLVLTFSAEVNPQTVNSDTIRIQAEIGGLRRQAAGSFVTNGRTVTWFPRMTSRAYPVAPPHGLADPRAPILPDDAGLNTSREGIVYHLLVPAVPSPNTVRAAADHAPLVQAFRTSFRTIPAPEDVRPGDAASAAALFSAQMPYYRDPLRLADVLAYRGAATGGGLDAWFRDPDATGGENPLFLNPSILTAARTDWRGRASSGEWVDQALRVQLLPPLTREDLALNTFPAGTGARDERLISNRLGARPGRCRPVNELRLTFTHPVVPNGLFAATAPIQVRVLDRPIADPGPVQPVAAAIELRNDAELRAGVVTLRFTQPIRRGWIHLTIDPAVVHGPAGTHLEANLGDRLVYIWPVEIRG